MKSTAAVQTFANPGSGSVVLERLREVRYIPDSVLRARRRSAAQIRLRSTTPRSVLFICNGNICRSPFAALLFARSLPPALSSAITVRSAGFIGPHRPAPTKALAAAARYDIDMSSHRSAQVTTEALRAADFVVVMAEEQARAIRSRVRPDAVVLVLGDLDPLPSTRRTILDPWGGSVAVFNASYDRIERCVREIVRAISFAD